MCIRSGSGNDMGALGSSCPMVRRRQFLARLGAAGSAALALNSDLFNWSVRKMVGAPLVPGQRGAKVRIRVAFSRARDEYFMGWPGAAYDHRASQALYTKTLGKAAARLGVELEIEPEPLRDTAHAEAFLENTVTAEADGALLVVMNLNDGWPMVHHFLQHREQPEDLPTVVFAPQGTQFPGHLQPYRDMPNCFVGATPDVEWLSSSLRLLNAVWQMRQTRFAVARGTEEREEQLKTVGTTLCHIPLERYEDAYRAKEGAEEVEAIARTYMEDAQERVEPSEKDVFEAARTYLAHRLLMDQTGCHAITVNCLPLVAGRRIPPPCMAYTQLLNEGTCGACDTDVIAGISLLLTSYLCGRPGFMHNPTPNTVRNTYGGAHCTAPTLMDGFDGAAAPYLLRTHHESDTGVAPQVLFREGQPATIMKFLSPPDRLVVATGTILRNIDTRPGDGVGGCRTGFEMAMDDVDDVLDIRTDMHNVLMYGKHLHDFRAWGQLAGVAVEHCTGGPA